MLSSVRRPLPQVTGISPKEGPPGTRVTIRGQDVGLDTRDLIGNILLLYLLTKYLNVLTISTSNPGYNYTTLVVIYFKLVQ